MIQWFPGHMAKAGRLIAENLKIVDVVLELTDARVPASSRNPFLRELIGEKPSLLVFTKEDLADPEGTGLWRRTFAKEGTTVLQGNFTVSGREQKKTFLAEVRKQAGPILARREKKGIKNKTVRTMVVGIPNVGKSTLINFLIGKGAAVTGDRPGVTKGKQWVKLENETELLDMPGILWPKFEDQTTGFKLAATGAISDDAFDPIEVAFWLLDRLIKMKPGTVGIRYKVEECADIRLMLDRIGLKRGFIKHGGLVEPLKTAVMLLDEFRGGKLGRFTLDWPEDEDLNWLKGLRI